MDTAIIRCGSIQNQNDEQKARQAGCDGYISKPIDTRTLPETIRQILDNVTPNSPKGET